MAFKLKNPLKTPLKQNHQEQFGPQLSDNIDPRDLLAPPAPQYNTVFPKFDDEGYSVGNVDGKRIIRFNRSSTTNEPREGRYEEREFAGFPNERQPIDVSNLNEAQRRFYEWYNNPEVRKKLREISATGGSASFTPGTGMAYATPYAFTGGTKPKKSNSNMYRKMGFKLVDKDKLAKKAKGIDVKKLW